MRAAALALGLALSGAARAADADDTDDKGEEKEEGPADLAAGGGFVLPTPPALTALDGRGARFDAPSAPTDFAVSAGEVFGDDGGLKAGGALEVGLRVFGATRRMSARDYLDRPAARLVSRSYLSVATAAGVEQPSDVRMAVGWRTLLIDGADPYLSAAYARAARDAVAACDDLRARAEPGWAKAYGKCVDEAYAEEAKGLAEPAWNAWGLVASAGSTFLFPEGRTRSGGADDTAAWLSAAWPLRRRAQVGLGVGWTQSWRSDPHEVGLSTLVRGGNRRARMRVEPGLVVEVPHAAGQQTGLRVPVVLGGELLVDRNLWLALEFGVEVDPDDQDIALLSQGTFRWGQASQPTFGPR